VDFQAAIILNSHGPQVKGNVSQMTLHFAFLVLEEHPYGREMLRILLENDLVPSVIIQEVSRIGDEERVKFLNRIAGQPVPPRLNELITGRNIPVFCTANHNDSFCKVILESVKPDVLVLGGTRIIKPQILEIPRIATVNAHPGLLPALRGSASVGWALYKDLPQGATAHYIDPGIDTGALIVKRELPVHHGDTYEILNYRIALLAGQLMMEALKLIEQDRAPRIPQDPNIGETYKVIPDDLLEEGKRRLAAGEYSHFVD
jgi:methionyl-tRNA formyltransferase